jgi:hypothetical protein
MKAHMPIGCFVTVLNTNLGIGYIVRRWNSGSLLVKKRRGVEDVKTRIFL